MNTGNSRKRRIVELSDEEDDAHTGHRFEDVAINSSVVHLGDRHYHVSHVPKQRRAQNHAWQDSTSLIDAFSILQQSLKFARLEDRLNNVAPALVKTCDWLFADKHFKDWNDIEKRDSHHGFLWIKGKPGSGKSTIMKQAVEHAQQHHRDALIVSYFFNARATTDLEKSPPGMYRSIVYQILNQSHENTQLAFARRFISKISNQRTDPWTNIELQNAIINIMQTNIGRSLYIFIDALDEGRDDPVREMVAYLQDIALRAMEMGFNLRICLSSRHYPHISIGHGLELVLEDQAEHEGDIRRYIHVKLLHDSADKDMEDFREQIFQKSRGIFLWVVIVVSLLNQFLDRGGSLHDARQLLDKIPTGLHSLFASIIKRDPQETADSVLLFQFVLFSSEYLQPGELYVAVQCGRRNYKENQLTFPTDQGLLLWLLNCSRGLVEVKVSHVPRLTEDQSLDQRTNVQFIHESVRDFLLSDDGLVSLQPALADNLHGRSRDILKQCCWNRIIECYPQTSGLKSYPKLSLFNPKNAFLSHASQNVLKYADQAQRDRVSQIVFLNDMMADQQRLYKHWLRVLDMVVGYTTHGINRPLSAVLKAEVLPHLQDLVKRKEDADEV